VTPGIISCGCCSVKALPLHRNPGLEIVFVERGTLLWQVDGGRERITPGHVFFTLPWQSHGSVTFHEPGNRVYFVQFELDRVYRRPVSEFHFHPVFNIFPPSQREVSALLCSVSRHTWPASLDLATGLKTLPQRIGSNADQMLLNGYVRIILAEMRASIQGRADIATLQTPAQKKVSAFLERLRDECVKDWSLEAMYNHCGMGKSLFTDTVKLLTGDSPAEHLRRLRVERGETLLKDTDESVTTIAMRCGFSTSQLFARTFKAFTNRAPLDFRREARHPGPRKVIDYSVEDDRDTGRFMG